MSDLDFYADVVTTGTVLGVGWAPPPRWAEVLGDGYLDDRRKRRMRRDYGLVEIYFHRVREVWECAGVGIQVHRLAHGQENLVPPVLRDRFGDFAEHVGFAGLAAALAERGHRLRGDNGPADTYHDRFVLPESNATVLVVSRVDTPSDTGPQVGHVWSIHLPGPAG